MNSTVTPKRQQSQVSLGMLLLKGRTFIALAILLIFFSFRAPNFTEWGSVVLMVKHASIYGLLALGMTMVIITGGIDLSVGSVVGLTGMVVGSLGMAGVAVIKTLADPYSKLPLITYWLLGSLASVTTLDVKFLIPPLAVGVATLLLLRWPLNVMALGEDEARALGVPTGRVRVLTLISATLITAVAVAVAGVIGWVGLMVPHLVRFWIGPNHRDLLPTSLLLGAIFLLWADNLARWLFVVELPLGVVTCACGIPVFLALLRRASRNWSD